MAEFEFMYKKMAEKWKSPIVPRDKVGEFTGGLLNPRTLANLDCKGEGPRRFRVGRKVIYLVDNLCDWLAGKSEDPE